MGTDIDYIFHPKTIAVAGASSVKEKWGYTYTKALLDMPFKGKIYPINREDKEILGLAAYRSVRDVPGPVDYVISCLPNTACIDLIDDCAAKGIRVIHFFTARFSETGFKEAADLERRVLEHARAQGVQLIGPNGMGVYNPREGISMPGILLRRPGNIGMFSQSGGNALDIVNRCGDRGLGFSKMVSYGNALDLNEADYLEYFTDDPETAIIAAYVEGVRDGSRFFRALRRATAKKPVIILKGGRTDAGTGAASSHTASLAGSMRIWQTACEQAGAFTVSDMDDVVDLLVGFTYLKPGKGLNVLINGGGGGASVLAADEAEEEGLNPLPVPPDAKEELVRINAFLGPWIGNPVDGSILMGSGVTPMQLLFALSQNPAYHLLMTSGGDGGRTQQRTEAELQATIQLAIKNLDAQLELARKTGKPMAVIMRDLVAMDPDRWRIQRELRDFCIREGFAVFPSIRRAARTMRRVAEYAGASTAAQ